MANNKTKDGTTIEGANISIPTHFPPETQLNHKLEKHAQDKDRIPISRVTAWQTHSPIALAILWEAAPNSAKQRKRLILTAERPTRCVNFRFDIETINITRITISLDNVDQIRRVHNLKHMVQKSQTVLSNLNASRSATAYLHAIHKDLKQQSANLYGFIGIKLILRYESYGQQQKTWAVCIEKEYSPMLVPFATAAPKMGVEVLSLKVIFKKFRFLHSALVSMKTLHCCFKL